MIPKWEVTFKHSSEGDKPPSVIEQFRTKKDARDYAKRQMNMTARKIEKTVVSGDVFTVDFESFTVTYTVQPIPEGQC